jgi:hypothetical protein
VAERRNCRVTGTPESHFPTSNYGFEIHIDTGLDNIVGNFQTLLAHLAEAIWMAMLFVLNLVLTLLGWALSLAPFSDNQVMASMSAGLERFYLVFTSPWLVAAMVAIGAWAVWRGLVQRQVASGVAGAAASVALMGLALWVLHEPRTTVGTAAGFANAAAQEVIAAPQRGSLSDPSASYANSVARAWDSMTLPGFAALNFSDLGWALSAPDPRLLATADKTACLDNAYLGQMPRSWARLVLAAFLSGDSIDCSKVLPALPAPRTNAEIWLRNSPGSPARNSLWEEFSGEYPYSGYLAIQGGGGAWTRLPLVILISLGLLGGIALLAWLSIRIFVQTAVAFVLVLSAPLALFLPAFGERGRAAFMHWGGTLLGALLSKLVYAALLSVALFGTTVISEAVPTGAGAFMAFLVMSAFWWSLFLKRNDILSFISVADDEGGSGTLGKLGSLYAIRQVGRAIGGAAGGVGRTAAGGHKVVAKTAGYASDHREASRSTADTLLERQARKRLDSRYLAAKTLIGEQAGRGAELERLKAEGTESVRRARRAKRLAGRSKGEARTRYLAEHVAERERAERLERAQHGLRQSIDGSARHVEDARTLVARADESERTLGRRFSTGEVGQAREGIRREVDRPVEAEVHAWRVGLTPEGYRGLSGREREDAHREVARQLRVDGKAFGTIADRPPGLVGRKRPGRRIGSEHAAGESSDGGHVERLHATRRRAARRGLSR